MGLTRPRFSQFDTTISSISDPITVLNKSSTLANVDVGFIINRNGGALANTAIFWNESANTFALAFTTNTGELPNANIAISEYANLKINTLTATFVNTTGNINAGNVTAQYVLGSGQFLTGLPAGYSNVNVTAYTESMGFTNYSNVNIAAYLGGNITVGNIIVPTGAGRFNGPFNESTTIQGVYVGNLNLSPRIGFFNGTAAQNWQIDNNFGSFRWYTPGVVRMTIDTGGNLNVPSGNIMTAGNVTAPYFIGSGQFLTGLPTAYSNVNVKAYTESMGFQNYGNVNVAAYLGGAVTVGGNLTVQGNLIIQGTTTTVNSTTLDVSDLNITVAKGAASAAAANGAGLTVDGSQATLLYTSSTDSWNVNKTFLSNSYINTTGNISAGGNASASYFTGSGTALTGINSFGNIFIDGQSPVLADNTSDTLTMVSGSGISITTDAANDSITFSSVSSSAAFAVDPDFGAVNDTVTASEDEGSVTDNATITYDLGTIVTGGLIYPDQLVLPNSTTASIPAAGIYGRVIYDTDVQSVKYDNGTIWTALGGSSYSNVQVATYLPIYSGNISNIRLGVSGVLTFADGTTQTTAGGGGSYSNVQVQAFVTTNGLTNYSNVNLSAYLGGAVTIGGNLTVNGDLFINGNLTTINSNNLTVNDSMIYLAEENPADTLDIGFTAHVVNPSLNHVGFIRDATDSTWKLFSNVATQPSNTVDFTGANYANLLVGNIEGKTAGYTIGYRDLPQVTASNVTLALADASKHFYANTSAPTTITVPSNANVAFPIGTTIVIVSRGVGNITIQNQGAGAPFLYLSGNATTTASRTLTQYGMATLLKTETNLWFVNGTGLV